MDMNDIFRNFGDIFGSMFGEQGGRGRASHSAKPQPARGHDLAKDITITLKESYLGTKKDISLSHFFTCESCNHKGVKAGTSTQKCGTCHGAANVPFVNGTGSIPGEPAWQLAPREMAWQGLSLGAICAQLKDRRRNGGKSLAEIQHHNAEDGLVGWGWNPGAGRTPVPGTQKMFGDLTQAWIEAGAACPKR